MRTLHNVLHQGQYQTLQANTATLMAAWKASLNHGELVELDAYKKAPIVPRGDPNDSGFQERAQAFEENVRARETFVRDNMLKSMVQEHHPELSKAGGVTSALGYNFYDLRAPVMLLFPVNVPMRNQLPRIGKVNDGLGTAAHWKATRNVGTPYAGVLEGRRGPIGTPDEVDYLATYKELGVERAVTFTAQFAGAGYADNLADEHLRGLYSLWLSEEAMIWNGNPGPGAGNNGYALGTAPTPILALNSTVATLATATNVSVAVVALTSMGNATNGQYGYGPTFQVATGLVPSYSRPNADGSVDVISGGTSAISAMSAALATTAPNPSIKASVPAVKGAFGYAWYVNTTDTTLANAKLHSITTGASLIISVAPTGTQTAAAAGLNVDNSYNPLDFTGLLSYAQITPGAGWTDLGGASLTSGKDGSCNEVETVLQNIYQLYQAGIDEIWGDALGVLALHKAIRWNGTSASGFQFITTRSDQNNLLGGYVVSGYQSKFAVNSPTGGNVMSIRMHPMIPAGTLYFHVKNNPYPHSRIPFTVGMLVQREYYSIEWPQVTRQWPFGTYVHEVLAHNTPWIPAVITGIGPFVGS